MTDNGGWIKFYRSTFDNPVVMKDPESFVIWLWLLSNAVFKNTDVLFDMRRITLKPGEIFTNLTEISDALKIDRNKVNRTLKMFESETQIEQRIGRSGRVISICNWVRYQQSETQSETQVKRDRNASETQTNSYNYIKKEKNVRMGERADAPAEFSPPSLDEVRAYCYERHLATNPERFYYYYQSKGWKVGSDPMTDWQAGLEAWSVDDAKRRPTGDRDLMKEWADV